MIFALLTFFILSTCILLIVVSIQRSKIAKLKGDIIFYSIDYDKKLDDTIDGIIKSLDREIYFDKAD